ncbi:hypothetical protein DFH07DRAFT_769803 [Mycena maculata]|uniref:Uncharacterized protein n=1 Tax=Mycena maculata TaxID=230809 RepID=A0AAD7JK48_9AGAR|nr:hypothetical protein DFH07DRAFT_769803 [Mycena maculata]
MSLTICSRLGLNDDRERDIESSGCFRSILFGAIGNDMASITDDWSYTGVNSLVLRMPDWSNLGWPPGIFSECYKEQVIGLNWIAHRQLMTMNDFTGVRDWTESGQIVVDLSLETSFSKNSDLNNSDKTDTDLVTEFNEGTTVVVDALIFCAPDENGNKRKLFTIEALRIGKVVGTTIHRSVTSPYPLPELLYP